MTHHAASSAPSAMAVGRRLSRIAALEMKLVALGSDLDRALDAVRRRHEPRLSALRRRLTDLREELESFCRTHRESLMPSNRKTLATAFGEVGFRKSELAVGPAAGLSADEACSRLRSDRLGRFVRASYRLNMPAIRRSVVSGRVSSERLARCGIAVAQPPDSFRYRLRREPAGVGAPGEGGNP